LNFVTVKYFAPSLSGDTTDDAIHKKITIYPLAYFTVQMSQPLYVLSNVLDFTEARSDPTLSKRSVFT